jgi:hypothetical protein
VAAFSITFPSHPGPEWTTFQPCLNDEKTPSLQWFWATGEGLTIDYAALKVPKRTHCPRIVLGQLILSCTSIFFSVYTA